MIVSVADSLGHSTDSPIAVSVARCYLNCDDIDRGVQTPDDYLKSAKLPAPELIT
ncbi:hypothetical protein ABKV19_022577 [Rosa sericea]